MTNRKLKEKKIKDDIINELDIPDVLDKVRPLAIDKAMEMEEKNQTVRLNFHRPAKIFATCFASFVGVVLIVVLGISLIGNKSNRMYEASNNDKKEFDSTNSTSASEPSFDDQYNEKPGTNDKEENIDSFGVFKASYFEAITTNRLSDEDLETYYNEILRFITQEKTK